MGSALAMVGGLLWLAYCLTVRRGPASRRLLSPFNGVILSAAVAVFLLFLAKNSSVESNVLEMVFASLFNTIRVFLANEDLALIHDAIRGAGLPVESGMITYTSFLYFLSPVLTTGLILSFLQGPLARLRYALLGHGDLYVFSELNERALLLAENVRRNQGKGKALIAFVNCDENTTESIGDLKSRADGISAYCFQTDAASLRIPLRCKQQRIHFFLLGEDEGINLRTAIELAAKYRDRLAVNVHVASTREEATLVLDSMDKGQTVPVRVRLIHETRTMIYHLLDTMPLFLGAVGQKISVLIIGAGRVGREAIKAACWCGQLSDHSLEIDVVDSDPAAESRFWHQCPGLAPDVSGSNCRVQFHCLDIREQTFSELLRLHPEVGYVICALGDDSLNLDTAIEIRSFYAGLIGRQNRQTGMALPIINVLVNDPFLSSVSRGLKIGKASQYELSPFGNLAELYTWELLSGAYLEQLALGVHSFYGGSREQFEQSEYNRHSSLVSALHCKYKLFCCPDLAMVSSSDWRKRPAPVMMDAYSRYLAAEDVALKDRAIEMEQRLERLAETEHRRWNAYMHAQGFQVARYDQVVAYYPLIGDHRHMLARQHPALVPWAELDGVAAWITEVRDSQPGHGGSVQQAKPAAVNLKKSDQDIVRAIPHILLAAEQGQGDASA